MNFCTEIAYLFIYSDESNRGQVLVYKGDCRLNTSNKTQFNRRS